jgi:hypothetical protein
MSDDYRTWLNSDRKKREIHFRVSVGLAKMDAKFSYLRLEGLNELSDFLRSIKEEDYGIFCHLQDIQENNLALHIMKKISEHSAPKSMRKPETSLISTTERLAAMDLLQGT